MTLLIASFVAGVLTVAAPCILPLLPVIVGSSLDRSDRTALRRALTITASLAASVILFTLLLKASTALLGVPQAVWAVIAGGIITLLGIFYIFPAVWEKLAAGLRFNTGANALLGASYERSGVWRDIAMGGALGPVFNSCSPTYALIVAIVLPRSFAEGLTYLALYAFGLALALLVIAIGGQAAVRRLGWLANPHGWLHRTIGIVFVAVGIAVIFGLDRDIQTWILEQGWYAPVSELDSSLRSQR